MPESHAVADKFIHVVSINGILTILGRVAKNSVHFLCCEFYTLGM